MSSEEVDKIKMEVEASRMDVMKAEKEISIIKQALRTLASADDHEEPNSLKITVAKVTGLPDAAKPVINIQLSSPIESQTITQLFDPLNPDLEGSLAHFRGVETENATLTVEVSDADIPLGSSAVLDIKPLVEMDILRAGAKITKNLEIAIVPDAKEEGEVAQSAEKISEDEKTTEDEKATEETVDKNDAAESDEEFEDAKSDLGESPSKGEKPESEEEGEMVSAVEVEEQDNVDVVKVEKDEVEAEAETEVTDEQDKAAVEEVAEIEAANGVSTDEAKDEVNEKITEKETEGENSAENASADITKPEVTAESEEAPHVSKDDETEKAESSLSALVPTCFVQSQIEFIPSGRDKKDELYVLLNKASKQKASAVDKLRKSAAALNRSRLAEATNSSTGSAVKAGFLNKKQSTKKEAMFLLRWYEKTLGPNSMVRKVFPIAKNYILFFGGVALMHFQGQQLSLPPPV